MHGSRAADWSVDGHSKRDSQIKKPREPGAGLAEAAAGWAAECAHEFVQFLQREWFAQHW
jgi:hypothetical protein